MVSLLPVTPVLGDLTLLWHIPFLNTKHSIGYELGGVNCEGKGRGKGRGEGRGCVVCLWSGGEVTDTDLCFLALRTDLSFAVTELYL